MARKTTRHGLAAAATVPGRIIPLTYFEQQALEQGLSTSLGGEVEATVPGEVILVKQQEKSTAAQEQSGQTQLPSKQQKHP